MLGPAKLAFLSIGKRLSMSNFGTVGCFEGLGV